MRISTLVLLLLFASWASDAQPQPPTSGNSSPDSQAQEPRPAQTQPTPVQQGSEANLFFVREMRSDAQNAEDRQDREDEQASRWYSIWLSGLTLVVLAFQVWLLVNQNRIIKKQSAIMEGQRAAAAAQSEYMREGLTHAAMSAEAARMGARVARTTLRLTQRAYLSAERFGIESLAPNASPIFTYYLKNNGSTRAKLLRSQLVTKVAPTLPETPRYPGPENSEAETIIEGRQAHSRRSRAPVLTEEEHAAITAGTTRLWLWGYFIYADVFGKEQTVSLCVAYDAIDRKDVVNVNLPNYHHST